MTQSRIMTEIKYKPEVAREMGARISSANKSNIAGSRIVHIRWTWGRGKGYGLGGKDQGIGIRKCEDMR
jgi:hypothetical protein